jgi:RNA polymerase sigma factor (sigma-70 family)
MSDSMQTYLNEIGRYPLLTATQEIQLARQVEAGAALGGKDASQLTAQEQRTLRLAERAKQKLMKCNLRLVVCIANKYKHRLYGGNLEAMDLIQEGALGLARAVELFDSTKGYKFSTYAYWWIRQAITRGIDSKERLVRLPQHGIDLAYKAVKYQRQYMHEHGRAPTLSHMAEALEIDQDQLELVLARNGGHRSLDDSATDTGTPIIDLVVDQQASDEQIDSLMRDEKQSMLSVALSCLTEAELKTVRLRFGLDGNEPRSLSSIAVEDGVSRERVRQRLQIAHSKMRLHLRTARFI